MKAILDFIKYNNAFPVILFVTLLGTGAAFAASPELRESVFLPEATPVEAPQKADATKLLSADVERYDAAFRIDALREDTRAYYITYSYQTFEVTGNVWQETRKTKQLEVTKDVLAKRDLKEYLSLQIQQVLAQEKEYLREAKRLASGATDQEDSSAYASLVGQNIDLSSEPEEQQEDTPEEKERVVVVKAEEADTSSPDFPVSKEELQKMIVAAVADFLTIDTSMPAAVPEETSSSAAEEPLQEEGEEGS